VSPRAKVTIDTSYEVVYEESPGTKMNDLQTLTWSCQPLRGSH